MDDAPEQDQTLSDDRLDYEPADEMLVARVKSKSKSTIEKAQMLMAVYGVGLDEDDAQKKRLELFIQFMLGKDTKDRWEFELAWQETLAANIEKLHSKTNQELAQLEEAAKAGDPQAVQALSNIESNRQMYAAQKGGLAVPHKKLILPR